MKKNVVLFTNTFPFANGEEFLETEILFLSKQFENVYIYPQKCNGALRSIPNNVFVKQINFEQEFSAKKNILHNWRLILLVFYYELILSKKRKFFLKKIKYNFNFLIWKISQADILHNELKQYSINSTVFYTYWFDNWAFLLSLVNFKTNHDIRFKTRIHGYDYEPTRRENEFIPFRFFEMKHVEHIYSISNYGVDVIKTEYPFFINISVSKLGVLNNNDTLNVEDGSSLNIVSCSSIIPLKRIDLIVEILSQIKLSVIWTHFGDGPEKDYVFELVNNLPKNIKVNLVGNKKNSEVIDFYKNNKVDLFLNVSEIEGIPVSIMEALSFGIPCIGCNVGGIKEIVTPLSGYLISENFDSKSVAHLIEEYYQKTEEEKNTMRTNAKHFWNDNYNAENNYQLFVLNLN